MVVTQMPDEVECPEAGWMMRVEPFLKASDDILSYAAAQFLQNLWSNRVDFCISPAIPPNSTLLAGMIRIALASP